jgi:anti-sigma factor RsiW
MNCREAEKQIFAARDGALESTQRAALMQHLGACAACRHLEQGFSAVVSSWQTAAQTAPVPDSELEWQKLRREIRGGAGSQAAARMARRKRVAWFAIPLTAAAALAGGLILNSGTTTEATPVATGHDVARVSANAAEKASTVVFVDDKSGWTFVVATDDVHRG